MGFSTIEQALSDLRAGKLIVCIDDPSRENEGDLICAAEFASAELVNRMAGLARGLICLPVAADYAKKLRLPPMSAVNSDNHETAFLVSIDHVETTTGISAAERALTARKLVSEDAAPSDFRRPGHLFPLLARPHGVLERRGHTEATVDLCRLAGLKPAGLCCEIMREDGEMMRTKELLALAEREGLCIISIEDLVRYRERYDYALEEVASAALPSAFGDFQIHGFLDPLSGLEHIALVKGDLAGKEAVLCRMHSECMTGDVFGSRRCDCGEQLQRALRQIEAEGQGVLLYLRQEGRGIGLLNKLKAYALQEQGLDTVDANRALGFPDDLRNYAPAAAMLRALGVRSLRLMTNNPDKIAQLTDFGIPVTSRVSIEIPANRHDIRYLRTKRHRMGHLLDSTLLRESC